MFIKATTITSNWERLSLTTSESDGEGIKIRDMLNNRFPTDKHLIIRTKDTVRIYYMAKERR